VVGATLGGGRGDVPLSLLDTGRLLALVLPLALLGGALGSQYLGGLYPCEMCFWQRWPHGAAILLAGLAFTARASSQRSRVFTLLAAFAIAVSGAIGVYHAGVELGVFQGFTTCAVPVRAATTDELLEAADAGAAGPLRPNSVGLSRHFHGRVECDPVARRSGGDRMADDTGRRAA
jgi:hypothetical protein